MTYGAAAWTTPGFINQPEIGVTIFKNLSTGIYQAKRSDGTVENIAAGVISSDIEIGTTEVMGGTPGSVLFIGATNMLQEDNANFFWDDIANSLGLGTNTPDASSVLDMTSTTKGFLWPRMTEVQRDAVVSPAEGLFIYNSTTTVPNYFDGTQWQEIGGSGDLIVDTTLIQNGGADRVLFQNSVGNTLGESANFTFNETLSQLQVTGTAANFAIKGITTGANSGVWGRGTGGYGVAGEDPTGSAVYGNTNTGNGGLFTASVSGGVALFAASDDTGAEIFRADGVVPSAFVVDGNGRTGIGMNPNSSARAYISDSVNAIGLYVSKSGGAGTDGIRVAATGMGSASSGINILTNDTAYGIFAQTNDNTAIYGLSTTTGNGVYGETTTTGKALRGAANIGTALHLTTPGAPVLAANLTNIFMEASRGGTLNGFDVSGTFFDIEDAYDGDNASASLISFKKKVTGVTVNSFIIDRYSNWGFGVNTFGSGKQVMGIKSAQTNPSSSIADGFLMYGADIAAGNSAPHFRTENGSTIKLFTSPAYTVTNVTTDRTYDAGSTTVNELANVVGTLIADLQATGLVG